MKRLLICLVALIAVFALVMPASAAEMKVNGIWNAKAWARDNYDGDDDTDDATQYVTQRFRSYWNWIASENLKLVYKNEIDIEWGDSGPQNGRNSGGGLSGDSVNLETKNIYLEFMVPDTPVKATLGLQGITLHKGWFISDDAGGARFDMNFDPVSITAYWIGVDGLEANDSVSSDDVWQAAVSGAYKAENMDARLSLAYQRNDNDLTSNDVPESDDLYLLMGEFGMSFDMVSFDIVAATNFGEVDSDGAGDRDYEGFMFAGSVDIALDMATITVSGAYVSGDDEGDLDEDFQGLAGQTFSWAEIISDGYSYDRNASLAQIGGANRPSNMYYVAAGVDLKPTDTTTIMFDVYYVGMVEDRTIAGEEEDEIGIEVDARLTQKIYDNLSMTIIGAYMFAEDGYGVYDPADPNAASNSGDDAFHVGLGLDFKF
ncbi:MAG: hypothetical protein PVH15_13045 [Syntrophobacterales bacterium]|jgi:hypothetical protein